MKLRGYALALAGVTLVPLALVAVLAVWLVHDNGRRDMERALLDRARALTVAVDREVETSIAGLQGLAASSDLESGDLARFYEQARRVKGIHARWLTVALIDPAGRQLLNLLRPPGSSLASVAESELFQRTLRTLKPEVSNLVVGVISERWTVAVYVPLLRDGKLRYIVGALMTPDGLASVLEAAQIPGGSVGCIIDRNGIVVASTRDHEQRVGRPASASDLTALARADEAVLPGPVLDGREAYTALSRARSSQFAVAITVPAAQIEGPLSQGLWLVSSTAAVAFGLALCAAIVIGRRMKQRMGGLKRALAAFGRGETIPELPTFWVSEFRSMTQSLAEAMALLRERTEALQESERRYRAAFEKNPAGMYLTMEDGRIFDCNEAGARLLGAGSPALVVGANVEEFYADPKDHQGVRERVAAEGSVVNAEIQFRRRDGRLIWVLLNGGRASDPSLADYETTLIDITEHKAAEELRIIARLANAAAHEINNPLTLIVGRLAMLAEDPSLEAPARERVAQARAAAERIREIVADMHHLTRVELFEHTSRGLPDMIDIKKSAGGEGGPRPPRSETESGA